MDNCLAEQKDAGATICGVEFKDENKWQGYVLGDSCAVRVSRGDHSIIEILASENKTFDNSPDYYDSFQQKKGRGIVKTISGVINTNELLLLVTDPFAEFFQSHAENSKEMVKQALAIKDGNGYRDFVDEWRAKGLHNDDSTLCIVEYDASSLLKVEYQMNIEELIEAEKAKQNDVQ